MEVKIEKIENEIVEIKQKLMGIGDMRPGSLTQQFRKPKEKVGGFFQVSYTHKMKSRTEYVRLDYVETVRIEIQNYKEFKKLTEKWSDLALELSLYKMKLSKQKV